MSKLRIYPKQISVSSELLKATQDRIILCENELYIDTDNNIINLHINDKYKSLTETPNVKTAKGSYITNKDKIDAVRDLLINESTFYEGYVYKLGRTLDIVKHYREAFRNDSDWYRCPEVFMMNWSNNIANVKTMDLNETYAVYQTDTLNDIYTHIVFDLSYPISDLDPTKDMSWGIDHKDILVKHVFRSISYSLNVIRESYYIEDGKVHIIFKAAINRSLLKDVDFSSCESMTVEYIDDSQYDVSRNTTIEDMVNLEIKYLGVNKWSEYNTVENEIISIDNII